MTEDERLARLEERVSNWMDTTTSYRKALCSKLDVILDRLNNLPCPARVEIVKALRNDVSWLQRIVWTIMLVGIPSIVSLAVAWGAINTTVERNTKKWDSLDKAMIQEAKILKAKLDGTSKV